MSDNSSIEWTDATWNPTTGCSIVSPGCTNCYAMKTAHSLERRFASKKYAGLTKVVNGNAVWTGEVRLDEDALLQPLKWKRGRKIFVNSMSDLFHEALPDEAIDRVFAVMALCPQHTFQVLTKRAERMRAWFANVDRSDRVGLAMLTLVDRIPYGHRCVPWPLPNVWLGISAERQQEADERIPHLLQTPAAVRFVSAEPLLGPISLRWAHWDDWTDGNGKQRGTVDHLDGARKIDWLICGGESGPGARPINPQWARDLRDECAEAGVAFFHKQNGEFASVSEVAGPGDHYTFPDGRTVHRVGKKAAGRLLDGRTHDEFPECAR